MEHPKIVSAEAWQQQRDALLVEEKQLTRQLDALAAKRRRLPMVKFENKYAFVSPSGTKSLLDLFEGRRQLVLYQFMDRGPDTYCPGCTNFTNNAPATALPELAKHDVSYVVASNMPLAQMQTYFTKMGWTLQFVSSHGTAFSDDTGAGNAFLLNAFLRDGDNIYRTYTTTQRGVDRIRFSANILDIVAFGRQEAWEDSPPGWPQHPTYG